VGGSDTSERDDGEDSTADHGGAVHLTDDARLAVNVNYPSDVRTAERLLNSDSTGYHTDQ